MSQGSLEAQLRPLTTWLARYMNAHRFLWLMSLACFLMAWNRGIALLYGSLALMLALIAVSWLLPWWAMRGVRIQRRQWGEASAGGELVLQYQCQPRQPLLFVTVTESLLGQPQQHFLPRLEAGTIQLSYPSPPRGVYQLPAPQLSCGWPFGFVQRPTTLASPMCEVRVQPKVHSIRQLPQPCADNPLMVGADSQMSRGAHSEFAGVRPHRDGDSMKHVHWGASARQQQLVVREFHSFDQPSWLIVIDGNAEHCLGQGSDTTFEYALQIGASMLEFARRQQLSATLVVAGDRTTTLSVEPGSANINDALWALAGVQADGQQDYSDAIRQAVAQRQEPPIVVTIRTDRQTLDMPSCGGHLDLVYAADSFDLPMANYAQGWRQLSSDHWLLHLHQLSKLHQVLSV
ncbi:hypothetical protein CHH28_05600 [Bacterioplanes sanyensis]|uniref:DUF58 domain-containing protein n=1 Tax=Bacterioplanes sanyensis TaxID=1249553 RepID=A0A222FIE6_9GAMM|nr:DUF58 domain-containing protein [Bacterioplanes sanyensis]ASP38191.1 hypothetical protein CHH28_05600 [Bacterioplanes sanyensis]